MPTHAGDFLLAPSALRYVTLRGVVDKKSNGLFGGWAPRFLVVSGNSLYIYVSESDTKPKRVIHLDDAVVSEGAPSLKRDHAFTVTSRGGKGEHFAAASKEEAAAWRAALHGADLGRRLAAASGASGASAGSNSRGGGDGGGGGGGAVAAAPASGSGSGSSSAPADGGGGGGAPVSASASAPDPLLPRCASLLAKWMVAFSAATAAEPGGRPAQAALDADTGRVGAEEAAAAERGATGDGVCASIAQLLGAQQDARVLMGDLAAEGDALRAQLEEVAARSGGGGGGGGGSGAGGGREDVVRLRARLEELAREKAEALLRAEALSRELTTALSRSGGEGGGGGGVVAPPPRGAPPPPPPLEPVPGTAAEVASLRARLAASEAEVERARRDVELRVEARVRGVLDGGGAGGGGAGAGAAAAAPGARAAAPPPPPPPPPPALPPPPPPPAHAVPVSPPHRAAPAAATVASPGKEWAGSQASAAAAEKAGK
jgi:hypothetical protein